MTKLPQVLTKLLNNYNVTGNWFINQRNKSITITLNSNYISHSIYGDIYNNYEFDILNEYDIKINLLNI